VKPYYDEGGITIYLGDCRELLPELGTFDLEIDERYCEIAASRLAQGVLFG
jgi:hypothetical protein